MTGAAFNTGNSKQDYGTPHEFIAAVQKRFGHLCFDLAASADNSICDTCFYSEEDDSLTKDWWRLAGLLWLNPPFRHIKPWVKKCAEESAKGARIVMLVPASVGSCWFADHVFGKALVLPLRPRLVFVGHDDPYPKDLMALIWEGYAGFELWKWK